jgi:hypothetical protein
MLPRNAKLLVTLLVVSACGSMPSTDGDAGAGGGSATGGGSTGGGEATGGGSTGGGSATGGGSETGGGSATGGGSSIGGGSGVDAGTCAGTTYCEDFETYSPAGLANNQVLGPWKASVAGDGGVLSISALRAKNGVHALRYTVPAGGPAHGTLNQKHADGLVPGNDLFGRAWVYYGAGVDAGLPLGVHSWLFQANGPGADGGNTSINLGGGSTKLQLNYHFPASSNEQSVQGGTVTTDVWHCVQWEYRATGAADGGDNQARVWLDGAKVIDVATSKGWDLSRPWNNFDVGFTHYQVLSNGVDVFIDDFALADHSLACP